MLARPSLELLDLFLAAVAFVMFASAYPDTYRTRLWEIGGEQGWNSDPSQRIYYYANFEEPPEVPLIWSQRLTDSNLAIAVLGVFVSIQSLLIALIGFDMGRFRALACASMASLWAYSSHSQNSGDFSVAEHHSHRPWYLERGCRVVGVEDRSYCVAARSSFGFSVLLTVYYSTKFCVYWALVYRGWVKNRQRPACRAAPAEELVHRHEEDKGLLV